MFANLKPRVLIVDDELQMRSALTAALEDRVEYLASASSAQEALLAIESGEYDIVLSDMYMPHASGLDLLDLAHKSHWDIAVVLITGKPEPSEIVAAMRLQAADFLFKPIDLPTLWDAIDRTYHRLLSRRESREYRQTLEHSLQRRTLDLENALHYLETNYAATLNSLVSALDAREQETCAHSFRVRAYTAHLARLVGYPPSLLPQLGNAALLHDIGKIAISDTILLKSAKLTTEEFALMKEHTRIGEQMVQKISVLQPASLIIRHHHEKFDGTGYPYGHKGEEIAPFARICAISDVFDALTSVRPYKIAWSFESAVDYILARAGSQFDPVLIQAFNRALPGIIEAKHRYADEPAARQGASHAS